MTTLKLHPCENISLLPLAKPLLVAKDHGSNGEFTGQQIHRDPASVSKFCPGVSTQKDTLETRPQGDIQSSAQSSHKLSGFTIMSFNSKLKTKDEV